MLLVEEAVGRLSLGASLEPGRELLHFLWPRQYRLVILNELAVTQGVPGALSRLPPGESWGS